MCSLYRINVDGSGLTPLHGFCAEGDPVPYIDYEVDWSPNGSFFAYTSLDNLSSGHLMLLNVEGSGILRAWQRLPKWLQWPHGCHCRRA